MWLHRLFNPHCEHCISESHELVDTLRRELEKTQRINEQLMARLLEKPSAPEEVKVETEGSKQIGKPYISWTARRQMLEAESRQAAKVIEERKKEMTVTEIEKELGVENG